MMESIVLVIEQWHFFRLNVPTSWHKLFITTTMNSQLWESQHKRQSPSSFISSHLVRLRLNKLATVKPMNNWSTFYCLLSLACWVDSAWCSDQFMRIKEVQVFSWPLPVLNAPLFSLMSRQVKRTSHGFASTNASLLNPNLLTHSNQVQGNAQFAPTTSTGPSKVTTRPHQGAQQPSYWPNSTPTRSQPNFSKIKCYECGKLGHIDQNCPDRKQTALPSTTQHPVANSAPSKATKDMHYTCSAHMVTPTVLDELSTPNHFILLNLVVKGLPMNSITPS